MVISSLVSLRESVVISLASSVISESANVGFLFSGFVNFNRQYFDLVISESDFDFEHIGHDELVSFN